MLTRDAPVLYSVDLARCHRLAGLDPKLITSSFIAAMERAGATVVQTSSHEFPGAGLTSVLILAESHAVIHTWPETGTVNVDIFSCSSRLKSLQAIHELGRFLGAADVVVKEIPRADGYSAGHPAAPRD